MGLTGFDWLDRPDEACRVVLWELLKNHSKQ